MPLDRQSARVVDLFAGPGGWSEGLKALGYTEVGVEWDEAACQTARAAGHERVQADVAALDPYGFCLENFGKQTWPESPAPEGLIASPPCPTFSNAGKGAGRRDMEHVIACALELAVGNDTRDEYRAACEDKRSILVVEPLRWALELRPEWIALEQVPPVLELWTLFGHILEQHGYSVWVGVLEAERYGVPQTRERAILMASRTRTVHPPRPTHQRYVPGEPQRHDVTMLGEVLPWVSMAEALGWTTAEPAMRTGNFTAVARDLDGRRSKAGSVAYERQGSEPSPTLATSPPVWVQRERSGDRAEEGFDPAAEPCQTLTSKARSWTVHRPSTNVNGDPRIAAPGRHDPETSGSQYGEGTVRVTVQEASVLQSFRPDYPWQGSRSKQFQQVGNAVPPLLARAVLAELVDPQPMEMAA